jgi:hypothetical protein
MRSLHRWCPSREPLPDIPCHDAVAITARTSGVSHSWYGLILSEGRAIHYTQIMSGTLIATHVAPPTPTMFRPTIYRNIVDSLLSETRMRGKQITMTGRLAAKGLR